MDTTSAANYFNNLDVPLSVVIVSDDLAVNAVYVSGDDGNDFLEVGKIWILTVNYGVTFNDSEWLINIAAAISTDELDVTVGDEGSWTMHTRVPETSAAGRLIQTLGVISLMGQCSLTRNRNQSSWITFPATVLKSQYLT